MERDWLLPMGLDEVTKAASVDAKGNGPRIELRSYSVFENGKMRKKQ